MRIFVQHSTAHQQANAHCSSVTMEAEPMLCQAEILHSTLQSIVSHEERKAAELKDARGSTSAGGLRSRTHVWLDEQDNATKKKAADLDYAKDLL